MKPSGSPYSESDLDHGGARPLRERDKRSEKKQSVDDEYIKNHLTGDQIKKNKSNGSGQSFFSN